jgi:hypothetical protein
MSLYKEIKMSLKKRLWMYFYKSFNSLKCLVFGVIVSGS